MISASEKPPLPHRIGEMTQPDLMAFLTWLKKDKDYELCRRSFGEYKPVRDDPAKLAADFLASREKSRPEDAPNESAPAPLP